MSFSENEMRGLLTGKCIPGDMKVNEDLPAYLVRKFDALQEQVQQLAAENCIQDFIISAVRDLARETDGVSGWHLNGDLATWDEVLPELSHSDTPATDAVIREIGAKAVEGFGDVLGLGSLHLSLILKKCAYEHAAKLRVGEQP